MTRPLPDPTYPAGSPEALFASVLEATGLATDPETRRTPACFVELLRSLDPNRPPPEVVPLDTPSTDPILVRAVPFHSLCAHHLLPFHGMATIAYRPRGLLVGLGSLVRLLHHHARRPQVQERLGAMLAEDLFERVRARSVVVKLVAHHMCMEMRGVTSPGEVVTLAWRGAEDSEIRSLL